MSRNALFTSDPHFFDYVIFKTRNFKTMEEMNETIIHNILISVNKDDILYMEGDFCSLSLFEKLRHLNIKLMLGNHEKSDEHNIEHYIHDIYKYDNIEIIPDPYYLNHNIILSHKPIPNLPPRILNIHGHHHNYNKKGKYSGVYKTGKWPKCQYYNVAVDHHEFRPVSLYEIFLDMGMMRI